MTTHADIEAQIREIQQRKKEEKQKEDESDVGLGASGFFDQDIYNGGGKYEGYVTSIAPNDEYDVSVTLRVFALLLIKVTLSQAVASDRVFLKLIFFVVLTSE